MASSPARSALATIFDLNILGTIVGIIAAAAFIGAADAAGIGGGSRRDAMDRGRQRSR